jgi:hypothetical protein
MRTVQQAARSIVSFLPGYARDFRAYGSEGMTSGWRNWGIVGAILRRPGRAAVSPRERLDRELSVLKLRPVPCFLRPTDVTGGMARNTARIE